MEAPPAVEQTDYTNSVFFKNLPASDIYVGVVMGIDDKGECEFEFAGVKTVARGAEAHFGIVVDDEPFFIKTWPKKWSAHEKSWFGKLYHATVGEFPHKLMAGDMVGKAVMIDVENRNKTSKKGTAYVASAIRGVSKVPSALRGTAPRHEDLLDAWNKAMEPVATEEEDGNDAPF